MPTEITSLSDQLLEIQVQGDFVDRLTAARPVQAISELIWNALDAEATQVSVRLEETTVGTPDAIVIQDNGHGMTIHDAQALFISLGGSWKRDSKTSKNGKRMLHGEEGKGRLRALALGRVAEWNVTALDESQQLTKFRIILIKDEPRRVRISPVLLATKGATQGVEVRISELHKQIRFDPDKLGHELAEVYALYLSTYPDVTISALGLKVDPRSQITRQKELTLAPVSFRGEMFNVSLEVVEWSAAAERMLYLCNEKGLPLQTLTPSIHAPDFKFSAYLKSSLIRRLHDEGRLELAETDSDFIPVLGAARDELRNYFKQRTTENARGVIDRWKDEDVYPYSEEPTTTIQRAERQVFEIVASSVVSSLPSFQSQEARSKRFQLRMLRQAIERGPEELQLILSEVLDLPPRKRSELAKLLKRTALSSIISAAKTVADRLDFVHGLERLLFDPDEKKRFKERSQLHRLLADNTWLFGEEFALTIDDQSLTEVLRKHLGLLKIDASINGEVRRIDGTRGIVDLMLTRKLPSPRANEYDHLVVELKAPKVRIGKNETSQVLSYAFAVIEDERFQSLSARWTFWLISNDMDGFARNQIKSANRPRGVLWESDDSRNRVWVKTWSEIIGDAKARLEVFQQELNYSADHQAAVTHLRELYSKILSGTDVEDSAIENGADEPDEEDETIDA
jgi:hypothetical protein